jgi:hypothetical protein
MKISVLQEQLVFHIIQTLFDHLLRHAEGYRTDLSVEYKRRLDDLLYQGLTDHLADGAGTTVNLANFSAGVWDSYKQNAALQNRSNANICYTIRAIGTRQSL